MRIFLAEIRKIWTVRSTYFLLFIVFGLAIALTTFYIFGFRNVDNAQTNARALLSALQQSLSLATVILSFLAIISVGHEYRYNTILYSFSSARHRLSVLASKFLALAASVILLTAVFFGLGCLGFYLGQSLNSVPTVGQVMPGFDFIWKIAVLALVQLAFAFFAAVILRSLIGASAVILLLPSTIESLLVLPLKENVQYLPFSALYSLTGISAQPGATTLSSALVVGGYVLVLGTISAILLQKRDAN